MLKAAKGEWKVRNFNLEGEFWAFPIKTVFIMFNFIPLLSTVLSIFASGLLFVVLSIHLYSRIRRKFPISVNCWFCNTWTKVQYDDRDSFDCPNCLQYNGFTKDGDYNKIIPEQHDELMNQSTQIKTNKTAPTNGLCTLCNNNQQLKVFQLANFVPLVEENFDVEIEHFQEQLEKAYKLCRKCDKILKKTIEKQNAWIFGIKIKNLCKNGASAVKTISEQVRKGAQLPLLTKFTGIASVLLVLSIILIAMSGAKYFTKIVSKYIPGGYLPILKKLTSLATSSRIIEINMFSMTKNVKIEPFVFASCIGILVQVIGTVWEKYSATVKVNRLLCWIILLLTSWARFDRSYATYILFAEAFCCAYLIWTSFNKPQEKIYPQKPSGKAMRKLVKNLENTCTDFSDTSDFEDISSSSKNTNSSKESIYSTQTNLQNSFNTARSVLSYTDFTNNNKSHDFTDFKNHNNFTDFNKRHNYTDSNKTHVDLNRSLNNLHLGFKSPAQTYSVSSVQLKRPKPVLSPPKFQTNNSWLAGGFWRNDGVMVPAQRSNLSRSSSESSGFGSQHNEINFHQFVPPRAHFVGEFDKLSMNSEFSHARTSPNPEYVFAPISKAELYPNLQNNFMVVDRSFGRSPSFQFGQPIKFNEPYQRRSLFQNWSDKINSQTTQSFRDLNLHSNFN